MSDIRNWHSTATDNVTLADGGWPEGMAPSAVNNQARDNMGAIRKWYENAEWIDLGHSASPVSSATFVINGDQRTPYHVGRRIKVVDAQGTVYGTIASSTYTGATSTGIYITPDSGGLSGSISLVSIGIVSKINTSLPDITATTSVFSNSAGYATSASNAYVATYLNIQEGTSTSTAIVNASGGGVQMALGSAAASDVFYVSASVYGNYSGGSTTSCTVLSISPGNMAGTFLDGSTTMNNIRYAPNGSILEFSISSYFFVSSGHATPNFSATSQMTSATLRLSSFRVNKVK